MEVGLPDGAFRFSPRLSRQMLTSGATLMIRTALLTLVLLSPWTTPSVAKAGEGRTAVVTIYNDTQVHLYYQLRVHHNGQWGDWVESKHMHSRRGWQYHTYTDVQAIQIRFDRIGGDGEYTEKIYDLPFNSVPAGWAVSRQHGRKYYFQFDSGGRLLDLYRCDQCPTCGFCQ